MLNHGGLPGLNLLILLVLLYLPAAALNFFLQYLQEYLISSLRGQSSNWGSCEDGTNLLYEQIRFKKIRMLYLSRITCTLHLTARD